MGAGVGPVKRNGSVAQPGQQCLGVAVFKMRPADAIVKSVDVLPGKAVIGQQLGGVAVAEVAIMVRVVKDGFFVNVVNE